MAGTASSSDPDKSVFAAPSVDFAGFTITMSDVRPCSRYLENIRDFPRPHNVTDVRSWFRLVNQVAYAFSMAERMQPFRKLLLHGVRFEWSPELENVFRESKEEIVQEIERGVCGVRVQANMPRHGLVKGGRRLLAVPEALSVHAGQALLLH